MTTSSDPVDDVFAAFKRKHGLDDDWSVRFTADEFRAREMAKQYRESGHDVRVLPLLPEGEELDPESFDQFADAEHDPLRYVEMEDCGSCLSGTHVVLTKPQDGPDGSR
ncbi:MAG: hypothetical protein ABEH59_04970, partial [Halobacteriales archaeon]